jgi:hypothetical protein
MSCAATRTSWRSPRLTWPSALASTSVRSKGTLYLVVHQHGTRIAGRWVGLSYDGPVVTGLGAIARTRDDAVALLAELKREGPKPWMPSSAN